MPNEHPEAFSCIVIGSESLLIRCATLLLQKRHVIKAVVSNNNDVSVWCKDNGIPLLKPGRDLKEALGDEEFDYLFSITNFNILPEDVLDMAQRGAINFHDGPLPEYAGLNVTSWALVNGETKHAITWHEMSAGIDEGSILEQSEFDIRPDDTAFTLNTRCYEEAARSFDLLIDKLAAGSETRTAQDLSRRRYYARDRRPRHGGLIDWTEPAVRLYNLVRALDYGTYDNPLGFPIASYNGRLFIPVRAEPIDQPGGAPGKITSVHGQILDVATGEGILRISEIWDVDGVQLDSFGSVFQPGLSFDVFEAAELARLDEHVEASAREERKWLKTLEHTERLDLPFPQRPGMSDRSRWVFEQMFESSTSESSLFALASAYLSRLTGQQAFTIAHQDPNFDSLGKAAKTFYSPVLPLTVSFEDSHSLKEAIEAFRAAAEACISRAHVPRSLPLRSAALRPAIPELQPRVLLTGALPANGELDRFALAVEVRAQQNGIRIKWSFENGLLTQSEASSIFDRFCQAVTFSLKNPRSDYASLPLVPEDEAEYLLRELNDSDEDFDDAHCVHELISEQVKRTPDAAALTFRGDTVSYAHMNAKANRLANALRSRGVTSGKFVGLCTDRSPDLVIGCLAIWKAGGAYVPLDPDFPRERLQHMVEDSGLDMILTQKTLASVLPESGAEIVDIDELLSTGDFSQDDPEAEVAPSDLAYMIYTSGSTGKPKGVMVEHRNVSNFFTGMDAVIDSSGRKRWLAVTSLSFDISVLELFWTLARGFEIILFAGIKSGLPAPPRTAHLSPMDFSLFYFSSDESERVTEKYRLLLEGAKFADRNGFSGVWTPERHFHAFGGLYPNPAVTAAAVAAVTENVRLLAGSCVAPLHHSIRIAEEWAVVDNLSNGRVAIAFASGWQPNDFVLQPQNYADRKNVMFRQVEEVRSLWAGEKIRLENPRGKQVELRTLPRPVQGELPVWITTAGNPETFRMAGEKGYNILTHMLGQTVKEIEEKILVYREAWEKAGHEGNGHVSLMLHTFVGTDAEKIKEIVREPMKQYLNSSLGLIKDAAWSFPTFREKTTDADGSFTMEHLSEEDTDAVLELSFERYYESASLFGTVEQCVAIVDRMKHLGVDEIACLIDFGVETDTILAHLPLLKEVLDGSNNFASSGNESLASMIDQHGISHMQCTPSMARMLISDEEGKRAAGNLSHLMVGGEAFPPDLARKLSDVVSGKITNMYGPTETTIWSSTYDVGEVLQPMPIGRPIANTSLYVLDRYLKPLPMGVPGELFIGGEGVTRGYHGRAELTKERFVKDPYGKGSARLYRTGDLCRHLADGTIQYLGRNDFQVKIRGYRIELGEIESVIGSHETVRETVVMVREDRPGDQRITAYVTPASDSKIEESDLASLGRIHLPEYMIPSEYVQLDRMPLTPNGKIDRKALPVPQRRNISGSETAYEPPCSDLEAQIASVWKDALKLEDVNVTDNFFDLGGHSLLAVQVNDRLKELLSKEISLVDLFRYPTVRTLAGFLGNGNGEQVESAKVAGTSRAEERRKAMRRRRQMRTADKDS